MNLVIGATGFLGSAIVRRLGAVTAAGHAGVRQFILVLSPFSHRVSAAGRETRR
jgi:uncharacterized protein YbjT (DUF2867 family)